MVWYSSYQYLIIVFMNVKSVCPNCENAQSRKFFYNLALTDWVSEWWQRIVGTFPAGAAQLESSMSSDMSLCQKTSDKPLLPWQILLFTNSICLKVSCCPKLLFSLLVFLVYPWYAPPLQKNLLVSTNRICMMHISSASLDSPASSEWVMCVPIEPNAAWSPFQDEFVWLILQFFFLWNLFLMWTPSIEMCVNNFVQQLIRSTNSWTIQLCWKFASWC